MSPARGSGGKRPGGRPSGKRPASRPGRRERESGRGGQPTVPRGGASQRGDRGGSTSGRRDRKREGGDEAPQRRGPRRRADGGIVCVVFQQRGLLIAEPFFAPGERMVIGPGGKLDGELVLVVPDPHTGRPELSQRLGDPEIAADVIAALLVERDYRREHDERTLRAAADAAVHAPDPYAESRRDLTDVATFTIDPTTAKDFDDAISAERTASGDALIRVHIADVTSFLDEGGIVDRAGEARATSTYVPGLVAPMLPPQLADDACSLVPGVDRRAVTIEMTVADGICTRAEVYRSMICSDQRLTYDDVDEIFDGMREPQAPWAEPLDVSRQVARALLARRKQALELDIPEPEFTFDPTGAVTDQRQSQHTESHKLIEQLMVLANEQVARILEAQHAPGLFRIHEQPEATSVVRLVDQLLSLGIPAPDLPDEINPAQAAEIVAECSREVGAAVRRAGRGHLAIPILILRALKVASYSPANLGHAGLSLRHYCHFTSPIRRYPDIVCHRAVLALAEQGRAVIGEEAPVSSGGGGEIDDEGPLAELARHCSDQERASMGVEREADRIAKAFLLANQLRDGEHGKVFKGEITGMMPAGLFVNFGGGFDGLIPLRALRGEWWELSDEGTSLYAQSGAVIRLGDRAEVSVDRVDVPRGRVDLVPHAIGGDL